MPGKRRFGRVRELPSGRWQARYKGSDGIDRPAPHTFDSKTSAERWLTLTEAEIIQGDWIDPDAGRVLFGKYASDWIEERQQRGGGFAFGPPKSDAGHRTVTIPSVITPDLASHIVTYAEPGDDGLVFTSSGGGPLRRSNFCRRVWHPALRAAGLPPIHFHDLRHTGTR